MENPSPKNRKRKTKAPCLGCYLHKEKCMCEFIPKLDLATRLCLIIHHRELKRTTNTGRLAIKALQNSIMVTRGLKDQEIDFTKVLDSKYHSLLLFPSENAQVLSKGFLNSIKDDRPFQLIVPDGNWRQASKVNSRYPELSLIPRVKLPEIEKETLFMRQETVPNGMATLQAIALAFEYLENRNVSEDLHRIYQEKLKRTLKARGQLIE